jgi:pilus assembly protein Flp/PilA
MSRYSRIIARWLGVKSESGVTAIEYGLIASLIAVFIIAGVTAIGTNLNTLFGTIAGKLS